MPTDFALRLTLISSNYPCLELIFLVPKVFEPLKFDCITGCELVISNYVCLDNLSGSYLLKIEGLYLEKFSVLGGSLIILA